MKRPDDVAATDWSDATWTTMLVLDALLNAQGYLTTIQVGERVGTSRETARRILRTLLSAGWVHRAEVEGADLWLLGPELPRIGVQFHELLAARQRALRADFDRLQVPPSSGT